MQKEIFGDIKQEMKMALSKKDANRFTDICINNPVEVTDALLDYKDKSNVWPSIFQKAEIEVMKALETLMQTRNVCYLIDFSAFNL